MNILIVDDDPDFRESLAEFLIDEKHTLEIAASGNAAKALLAAKPDFDVVLSDYNMPNGNGLDLLAYIREKHPESPAFFMITGQASENGTDILKLGAQECIFKPFDITKFLEVLDSYRDRTQKQKNH